MKKIFQKIDDYLLINKPVIWISSIHWIVGTSCLIILLEIFIGLLAKFTFDVLGFHYIILVALVIVIFIWVMFQYRNYERVFSTKQTIKICLLNFAGYFFIGISTLILFFIFSSRLRPIIKAEEDFSQDLLAIRIASLRNSDIELIKNYPQLFTSKGSDVRYNNTDTVDLRKEYSVRGMLDYNPFIKRNLSDHFNVLDALRKVKGYKYVDSLLTSRESQSSEQYKNETAGKISTYYVTSELDEDPIFYKFLTSLTDKELDSLRRRKMELGKEYGFFSAIPDSSNEGMNEHFSELQNKIRRIVSNSIIPRDKLILTLIILLAVYAISFNYIITKKTSCLLAPFVYLGLYSIFISVSEDFLRSSLGVRETFWFLVIANLVFFVCMFILLRLKPRFIGSGLRFFIIQMLNVSALLFPIILLTDSEFTGSGNIFHLSILQLIIITIVTFLVIQFFFIKKIHGTLVK